MEYVVGIDIGGTCTDCVVVDGDGNVTLGKAFSTPPDFSAGILDSLGIAAEQLGTEAGELLARTRPSCIRRRWPRTPWSTARSRVRG